MRFPAGVSLFLLNDFSVKTIFITIEEFAGGGGATTGHKLATGRSVDVAVNHSAAACAMHAMNHPETLHFCQDVWQIDPLELLEIIAAMHGGAAAVRVAIASGWFSPDCKHFSKAKGGALVDKRIRGLAYIILKWCGRGRRIAGGRRGPACPLVLRMENVEEFKTWGPLVAKRDPKSGRVMLREVRDAAGVVIVAAGTVAEPGVRVPYERQWLVPDTRRSGLYFGRFVRALEAMGGVVEWRELRACEYGAPTIRKRLYLIVRFDGEAVVWPEATHGAPESPAVVAGLLQAQRTAAECLDFDRVCPSIFLTKVQARRVNAVRPLADATEARLAEGVRRFVLESGDPYLVNLTHQGNDGVESIREPFKTITGANRGEKSLVTPFLAYAQHGGAVRPVTEPMHTVTASKKDQNQLVAVCLARQFGTSIGSPVNAPVGTIVAGGGGAKTHLISAFLAQHNTGVIGHDVREPMSAVTASGAQQALVALSLVTYYGSEVDGQGVRAPLRTVTVKDRFGLVMSAVDIPPLTPEKAKRARRVAKFLRGHGVAVPGEFAMVGPFVLWDIGQRMLTPRELFRAQGFPEDYIIDRGVWQVDGRSVVKPLTKTQQVMMCGNSVSPPVAAAIIAANQPRLDGAEVAA